MAKGGLGSGFDFLYDENAADVQVKKTLRLSDMEPNRQQPRKAFAEEAIADMEKTVLDAGWDGEWFLRATANSGTTLSGNLPNCCRRAALACSKNAGTG